MAMPAIIAETYPEISKQDDFNRAHTLVIDLKGDVIPLDVTHTMSLPVAERRVHIGATLEPPTLWLKKTTFASTVGGVAIHTETITLRPDATQPFIHATTEKFTQDPPVDDVLPTRWTGPEPQELTGSDLETAFNTLYDTLDIVKEQEGRILGMS